MIFLLHSHCLMEIYSFPGEFVDSFLWFCMFMMPLYTENFQAWRSTLASASVVVHLLFETWCCTLFFYGFLMYGVQHCIVVEGPLIHLCVHQFCLTYFDVLQYTVHLGETVTIKKLLDSHDALYQCSTVNMTTVS